MSGLPPADLEALEQLVRDAPHAAAAFAELLPKQRLLLASAVVGVTLNASEHPRNSRVAHPWQEGARSRSAVRWAN